MDLPIELRDIPALLDLCVKATPGPWGYDENHTIARHKDGDWEETIVQLAPNSGAVSWQQKCDADFIAAARTALPAALEYIQALQKEGKP